MGPAMMRFNYEILNDVKNFLLEKEVQFRFIFHADDETKDGGAADTMR